MQNGIELEHNLDSLRAILAQQYLEKNEVTKDGWARIEPHLEKLWEHINKDFEIEIEVGQLLLEGIANYIIAATMFTDEDMVTFKALYEKPLVTSESTFASIDNANFYSVLIQNSLLNVIVTNNPDAPDDVNDALMTIGVSGQGQVTLSIINCLQGLWK